MCWTKQVLVEGEGSIPPLLPTMARGTHQFNPMKAPTSGQGWYVFTNYNSNNDKKFDLTDPFPTLTGQGKDGPKPVNQACSSSVT